MKPPVSEGPMDPSIRCTIDVEPVGGETRGTTNVVRTGSEVYVEVVRD
jgi:hypothetical protein